MKKRHVMRALVAAATALALTACGSTGSSDTSKSTSTASAASTSSGSEAGTENTITIPAGESVSQDSDITAMVAVDFTTMDPMDTSDTLSGGVQRMMMDGLFGFDENMQIIPMLATSYEANDEATEYTIHLREGVSFTDGTPWNADALIANVNKWADKSLGLKRTTFLCNVLDHAEKIDDYTVKIYLSQSFGAFISNLAHPATLIMSPKQIEAGEDACAQAPVGTGQYKFVEWVAGDHMKVELNKDWWAKDHTVYTLDLLGCGRSDKPAITYTNFLYVQLIVTFIKQVIGCPTDVIASGLSGSFVVTACNTAPKCFGRIMMINPTDLAKLNKIPDKRSRFLKRMIELPLVGTLLYHTLTGRSNIELLFTESYYHNPFHRSPEDVDAFYESAHLQSSAGKYLFASLAGNYVNLNIGHALKHIDNSIFLIGGEEEPGIAETFALYTALNTSIETQILPKTKHMPQMEAPQALLDQIQIFFAPVQ